jgi:hypothetical protein
MGLINNVVIKLRQLKAGFFVRPLRCRVRPGVSAFSLQARSGLQVVFSNKNE